MRTHIYLILIFCFSRSVEARNLWTPLALHRGALSKEYTDVIRDCWHFNFWAGGYNRSAKEAFDHCGDKEPLSALFFNKANFNAQEIFAFNTATSRTNPLLATSILKPRVRYKETGAVIGFDVQGYIRDCWRLGLRTVIPVRKIRITRCPSRRGTSSLGGQTINDVAVEKTEVVNGTPIKSFAYRLDFLSRLPYDCDPNCPGFNFNIVNYRDTDFPPANPITISNQDITNGNRTPVSAVRREDGTPPPGQFAIPQVVAQNLRVIQPTGDNIADNSRGRFSNIVNYTPLSTLPENQAELFIVPSVEGRRTTAASRVIQQHVNELIECIDQEAEELFRRCNISFNSQCTSGAGDLDTEFFAGHYFNACTYGEVYFGIKWPTGKKVNNSLRVFRQPTGNNGHYEFKLGTQGLWQPCNWASIKGDITWNIVQRTDECVAAAFQGACIKNIGTPLSAKIGWDYWVLHTDILLTPCWSRGLGIDFGYELYHKTRDTVDFCRTLVAVDCIGNQQLLDSSVLARTTEVTSHKIRGEIFTDPCYWIQLFGGGTHVVAGKNAPKETEWFVGFSIYF